MRENAFLALGEKRAKILPKKRASSQKKNGKFWAPFQQRGAGSPEILRADFINISSESARGAGGGVNNLLKIYGILAELLGNYRKEAAEERKRPFVGRLRERALNGRSSRLPAHVLALTAVPSQNTVWAITLCRSSSQEIFIFEGSHEYFPLKFSEVLE